MTGTLWSHHNASYISERREVATIWWHIKPRTDHHHHDAWIGGKVVVNDFRQITKNHVDYVTAINLLNAISYLCATIITIHVSSSINLLKLVSGQTCEFCLTYTLVSLDNLFGIHACQTCLGQEWEVDLIQACDLKRRQFLCQRRMLA